MQPYSSIFFTYLYLILFFFNTITQFFSQLFGYPQPNFSRYREESLTQPIPITTFYCQTFSRGNREPIYFPVSLQRTNRSEVFHRTTVLRNFPKFIGNICNEVLLFVKPATVLKGTPQQLFS